MANFKLLKHPDEQVGSNKESLEDVKVLFDIKFKKRLNYIEIIHCVIRLMMLYDTLKFPL